MNAMVRNTCDNENLIMISIRFVSRLKSAHCNAEIYSSNQSFPDSYCDTINQEFD